MTLLFFCSPPSLSLTLLLVSYNQSRIYANAYYQLETICLMLIMDMKFEFKVVALGSASCTS